MNTKQKRMMKHASDNVMAIDIVALQNANVRTLRKVRKDRKIVARMVSNLLADRDYLVRGCNALREDLDDANAALSRITSISYYARQENYD